MQQKREILGKIKGAFLKEEDAKEAAKGFGFWGSDGYILPLKLYENIEEYKNDNWNSYFIERIGGDRNYERKL